MRGSIVVFVLAAACGGGGKDSKNENEKSEKKEEAKAEGKKEAPPPAPSCPPLTFTVNGEARTGFVHGLAIQHKNGADLTWQVEMYNHDAVTCDQVLSKSGRQVKDGEIDVRAFAGQQYWGVGFGGHTQMATAPVKLVGEPPTEVGDEVVLCAEKHDFTRGSDGSKVVIAGTFKGTYCGVMEF